MEVEYVKDYLISFQKTVFPSMIERELKVKPIERKAVTIIGPRRAGKTFYFFNIISNIERSKVLYLDFEEPFLKGLRSSDVLRIVLEIFPEVVERLPEFVFLDEIQNVSLWESLVRSLLNRGFHVFITGSSSKLLSREVATQLRGRSITYLLLPFSFREYLKAKNVHVEPNFLENRGVIKRELKNYLEEGGFPEIVLREEKEKILKEYIDLAFFKDFVERHSVKSITLARYVFNDLLQNFSQEISVRAIERRLKSQGLVFNIMTLYKYVENLEDTLFIYFLKKFSMKAHERELWPRKVYLADTGLAKYTRFSQDYGKLMENIVFLHLLRETNKNPLLTFYYWKDYNQNEVDFVIKDGLKVKELVQVTYASSKDEIDRRETSSLLKASEAIKCNNLSIITWDYEDNIKIDNSTIKCVPLWKWLLRI
ncbi:MAG: ATP-binding protein [Nitrososphaeria archaeon]